VAPVLQQIESNTRRISRPTTLSSRSRGIGPHLPARSTYLFPAGSHARAHFAAQTGAVTLALPQDVQAEAGDYPEELFQKARMAHPRAEPEGALLKRAAEWIRAARSPIIVAGGGAIYSEASDALARFAKQTGIPVGETQAAKAPCPSTIRRISAPSA